MVSMSCLTAMGWWRRALGICPSATLLTGTCSALRQPGEGSESLRRLGEDMRHTVGWQAFKGPLRVVGPRHLPPLLKTRHV